MLGRWEQSQVWTIPPPHSQLFMDWIPTYSTCTFVFMSLDKWMSKSIRVVRFRPMTVRSIKWRLASVTVMGYLIDWLTREYSRFHHRVNSESTPSSSSAWESAVPDSPEVQLPWSVKGWETFRASALHPYCFKRMRATFYLRRHSVKSNHCTIEARAGTVRWSNWSWEGREGEERKRVEVAQLSTNQALGSAHH